MPPDLNSAWDTVQPYKSSPQEVDFERAVADLSKLPDHEYDRTRKAEAKRLGVREVTLDKAVKRKLPKDEADGLQGRPLDDELRLPDPWDEPADGAEVLDSLVSQIRRYLSLPDLAPEAIALWVLHSYTLDAARNTPRLAITSPEKGCGKSTVLDVLSVIVAKPLPAANISPAAVFRVTEAFRPTLLIDEADTFLRDNEDLRGVLNSGHSRATASVIRIVGQDFEARAFSTWGCVAIASIGELPDTLADRSIPIRMSRKKEGEQVERFRSDKAPELVVIARKAVRWASENISMLTELDPQVPGELFNRAADNWRPLLAIADSVGGNWPETARKAAVSLSATLEGSETSVRAQLLTDIKSIFEENNAETLSSERLVVSLGYMEERPWPEWKRGKPITVRQLATLLKPFGVKPKQLWIEGRNERRYTIEDFSDAFERYIPAQSARPLDTWDTAGSSDLQSARPENALADENPLKPNDTVGSSTLADREPPPEAGSPWENEL